MTTNDVSDTRISTERLEELLRLEIGERDRYLEGTFLWLKHDDKANAFAELITKRTLASRTQSPAEWEEISSAPTDGTPVWAISMDAQSPAPRVSWFDPDGRWVRVHTAEKFVASGPVRWWPTHWKPIPALERSKEETGEAVVWGNARSLAEAFDGEVWGRVVSAVKSEHFDVPLYASPAPVPVTITDADRERAAQAIYERGPSIGGDTEDGWSAQSNDYKRKAREIANVALSALSAKPGDSA